VSLKSHKKIAKKVSEILGAGRRGTLLEEAMKRGREGRLKALQELSDPHAFRMECRKIKERSITNMETLLEKFIINASRRGCKIHLAKDGVEAINHIIRIATEAGAKSITKTKSLTTEEIELNTPLEERGFKVVETDLGERIIQLAGEKPFHLVFPAVHKSVGEVANLFSQLMGRDIRPRIDDVMEAVRESLRSVFLQSDLGITGANIAIAETGTVVIETNEGNEQLVTSIPRIHIVVMGVEKIVDTVEEAVNLIRAHPMSSTGQLLTNYVSFISGKPPSGHDQSSNGEMHIIILDNGRRAMREDSLFREALYCIRCGACMNVCPTYSVVGGHIFGHIYPGPIGIPWTAKIHGIDKAAFSTLCISCGLCREVCPVDINIPMMIAGVKMMDLERGRQPLVNRALMGYESLYTLASVIPPVYNWLTRRSFVKVLMEYLLGIDRRRPIPPVSKISFKKWFSRRAGPRRMGDLKVSLFVDFFPNFIKPHLAMKVVQILEEAGAIVDLPPQRSSGYPYIAYGELKKALKVAQYNVDNLIKSVENGGVIVSLEPTATYALKFAYPHLLNVYPSSKKVAEKTYGVMEYLSHLVNIGRLKVFTSTPRRVGVHIPCHQRSLDGAANTIKLLKMAGHEVKVVETGTCCGMAGSFGMKKGPLGYDLAVEVGGVLFQLLKESNVDVVATESSVCSIHLEQGTGIPVLHPLELMELEHNPQTSTLNFHDGDG